MLQQEEGSSIRASDSRALERLRVEVRGAVQGVGFRPFVYRLATELGLTGWVVNDSAGVFIEVEGDPAALDRFVERLNVERPAPSIIQSLERTRLAPAGFERFEIRSSDATGTKSALILPDIATCADCLRELFDPGDRRYRYPFTNCTNCGPRFSIIRALPYDRPNTTMHQFVMCRECAREYEDPADRRFHAQPNACASCGPSIELWHRDGSVQGRGDDALFAAAGALRGGAIVALKGIGGFLLLADARSDDGCRALRERKGRPRKPFALMVRGVEQARAIAEVDESAEALLASSAAPIVLLPRRAGAPLSPEVAPGNPTIGVMLPSSPLHHLIARELDAPLVATSGNASDEPICTDEREALARLGGIADLFLVHDRPIERHVDDSVAWVVGGEPRLLRRARGFAPLPVLAPRELPCLLAVGAHMKSAVALSVGRQVFVSQHIGDLETPQALGAFERVIADLTRMYGARPAAIAHDLHPDYGSTRWALEQSAARGVAAIAVQHHHAHLAACLAEHGVAERALGVIWDGTGYGSDGSIWGGEFLLGNAASCERVAHLRAFRLPGGEAAVREPLRIAFALLWELYGEEAVEGDELPALRALPRAARRTFARMIERGFNAPLTTSAGRLFDGVSALLGLCAAASFEGEAAMALEYAAYPARDRGPAAPYECALVPDVARRPARPPERPARPAAKLERGEPSAESGQCAAAREAPIAPDQRPLRPDQRPLVLDWGPLVSALVEDFRSGTEKSIISLRFHATLVRAIADVAAHVGAERIALSGGCFQNRLLVEGANRSLAEAGHRVLLHRQVPPNDGCIALGQIAVAASSIEAGPLEAAGSP